MSKSLAAFTWDNPFASSNGDPHTHGTKSDPAPNAIAEGGLNCTAGPNGEYRSTSHLRAWREENWESARAYAAELPRMNLALPELDAYIWTLFEDVALGNIDETSFLVELARAQLAAYATCACCDDAENRDSVNGRNG